MWASSGGSNAIRFDNTVRDALHSVASPALTEFLKWVSNLNGPAAMLFYTLAAAGLFLWRSYRTSAALIAVTMAGGACLDGLLCDLLGGPHHVQSIEHRFCPGEGDDHHAIGVPHHDIA